MHEFCGQIRELYGGVGDLIQRYWKAYGGFKALLLSPYLHVSFAIALILFPLWTGNPWWDFPLAILPNILGFTLAGFTILGCIRFGRHFVKVSGLPR